MPLLKSYLERDVSSRDRALLAEIMTHGIKTDTNLILDPNAVVAKSNGRITKADQIANVLSRIQIYACQDIFDVIGAIESIVEDLGQQASTTEQTVRLVTSMTTLIHPEEQSPSVLMTSYVKPGQGVSWRYATDLLLHLSRLPRSHRKRPLGESFVQAPARLDSNLFGDEKEESNGRDGRFSSTRKDSSDESATGTPTRVAEIMKSKRLKIGEWCLFDLQP
ncbi:hypothetical protein EDD11_008209 [Mortierella claussenii]|nr:hypothetical protein EDD11_008209 [Mortierella claussenii]